MVDGSLCQFARDGALTGSRAPLATAILEFRRGPMCVFVLESPHGLLPGIPNLYCLDGDLRLQWMAEWRESCGPCIRIVDATDDTLTAESASGVMVRLDTHTGRIVGLEHPMAETG